MRSGGIRIPEWSTSAACKVNPARRMRYSAIVGQSSAGMKIPFRPTSTLGCRDVVAGSRALAPPLWLDRPGIRVQQLRHGDRRPRPSHLQSECFCARLPLDRVWPANRFRRAQAGHNPGQQAIEDISYAYAVSEDASVVVGSSGYQPPTDAFIWTQGTGMVKLSDHLKGQGITGLMVDANDREFHYARRQDHRRGRHQPKQFRGRLESQTAVGPQAKVYPCIPRCHKAHSAVL